MDDANYSAAVFAGHGWRAFFADRGDDVAQLVGVEIRQVARVVVDRLLTANARFARNGPDVVTANIPRSAAHATLGVFDLPAIQADRRARLADQRHTVKASLRVH